MPVSSTTSGDRTPVVSPAKTGSATLPPTSNTLSRPVSSTPGISHTTQSSSLSPGGVSAIDTSSIRRQTSLHVPHNSRYSIPLSPSSTSRVATLSFGALPGESLSTPTLPIPQGCPNDMSTTAAPSQSSAQVNAPFNQGSRTTSVGLIVALALVGCLLVALIAYLTLRYRRRIRRTSWVASPSITADTRRSGDHSESASAEASNALDAIRGELVCPQNSQPDVRLSRTSPGSKIGIAL
ncbi:hypothetical protein EDD15DRAFT_1679936 [Pisolithus albus]|nr:hypothetical protein EDD15DRAFT_1679936 [Pisolithus albus]